MGRHPTPKTVTVKATRHIRGAVAGILGFLSFVAERFNRDAGLQVAAALTYTSLLALVPLLAVMLAVLAAFPAFEEVRENIRDLIFSYFVPDVGAAVQDRMQGFIENTGQLTAAGTIGLTVAALMLLVTIEAALNKIFQVTKTRPILPRLFVYWTLLTLGPLLFGTALSVWGYLQSLTEVPMGAVAGLLPTLLTWMAFAMVYLLMPNREVRPKDAMIGALVAALGFAALRFGFGVYLANVKVYETIYGAVAAVPLFLVWVFASWAVVLIGAEVAATLPEWRARRHHGPGPLRPRHRLALALDVLAILLRSARSSGEGVRGRDILSQISVAETQMMAVIEHLIARNLVRRTGNRFLLSRDLETVNLYDLIRALDLGISAEQSEDVQAGWRKEVQRRLQAANKAERDALDVSVKDLLTVESQ